jgi:hypothetical protein
MLAHTNARNSEGQSSIKLQLDRLESTTLSLSGETAKQLT